MPRGFEPRHRREEANAEAVRRPGETERDGQTLMVESERPDAGGGVCPQCGTEVTAGVREGAGGSQTGSLPSLPVEIGCPRCGQRLRRAVGGAWQLADEADLGAPSSAGHDTAGDGPADPDSALDEALAESFPASDPPAL